MSVQNFNPVIWEAKILKELDKQHMLVKNCTTEYSGKISGVGSKVKVNSIATPTITQYVPNSTVLTPEQLQDESRMLEITEAYSFDFYIDDVDEKQTTGGLMSEALRKASIGLKDKAEQFIAGKYTEAGKTITEASLTSANIFSTLMKGQTALVANNVSPSDIVVEVSPYVYQKAVLGDIVFTDTGKTIRDGYGLKALDMTMFITNNLSPTVTSDDVVQTQCLMRTKDAIGYAEQIMKTAKFMPENAFSEAIKGLHVYGAKVLKPKELVHMDLKTAAESAI